MLLVIKPTQTYLWIWAKNKDSNIQVNSKLFARLETECAWYQVILTDFEKA